MNSKLQISMLGHSAPRTTILLFVIIATFIFNHQIVGNSAEMASNVLVEPLLKFSANMMRAIDRQHKNVIFSPMSIHMALNLVLVGAEPKSQTEKELFKVLGYESLAKGPMEKVHEAYAELEKEFKRVSEEAKKEREALEELSEREQASSRNQNTPLIHIWNLALTKNAKLQPSYVSCLQKYYNGAVESIDGKNATKNEKILARVNQWAKDAGYEKELLSQSELAADFRMLLLSAVRVEAFWENEFHDRKLDELFYNNGLKNKLVKDAEGLSTSDLESSHFVEFTERSKANAKIHHDRVTQGLGGSAKSNFEHLAKVNFRAIKIELIGNLSYTILEPLDQSGTGNELSKMSEALLDSESSLANVLEIVDEQPSNVEIDYLAMPKFKFETDIELVSPLKKLGLLKVFDNIKAELTQISNDKLHVDKAKHEAMIEVNKVGLKAAGVTKMSFMPLMAKMKKERIVVEVKNPFLFVVRYDKLPLFVGQLSNVGK